MSRARARSTSRDWTGKSADRAVRALQAQGLQVDASDQEYSDTVAEGHVISQDPVGRRPPPRRHRVAVVSKGPELVEVPGDLRAMGVEAATELLEGLGFKVEVEHADLYLGLGYVVGSDPEPGSMAPKGSTVILQIV